MSESLLVIALKDLSSVDEAFLRHFCDELKTDDGGIPYGILEISGVEVRVLFQGSSLRIKKHSGDTVKSQYPGLYIQAMEPTEDTEKPNSSQETVLIADDKKTARIMDQEVWWRFQYQVTTASMSYVESRRLSQAVANFFPKKFGARHILISEWLREIKISDRSADNLLEDGIFRSNFTFEFSAPLYQGEGRIEPTVHQVDVTVQDDSGDVLGSNSSIQNN